jgi:hypothetical protein
VTASTDPEYSRTMSEIPIDPWPAVVPMLSYENAEAAIAFLHAAFGFEERQRFVDGRGKV